MKFDFVVVGATGMQGRIVSKDLLKSDYSVLLCGRDKSRVMHLLKMYNKTSFAFVDLRDKKNTIKVIKNSGANVVVNCAEGDWNIDLLKMCIEAGVNSIDLGSDIPMTRKQFRLNYILKKKRLIHITGCGSVPGIGNVMLRYGDEKFDSIDTIKVGFAWNSNIKKFVLPFSIASITEEFVVKASYLHNHKIKMVKPMDSLVNCYHRAVGKQKEFKVGHHPETYTFHKFSEKKGIKNIEFYAGFPEHSMSVIQMFIDVGLANKKPLNFHGMKIRPIDFLTEVLKNIKSPKGYTETENLWVFIEGKHGGKKRKVMMECIVPTIKGWEDAGCNIDTGMPASIIAQMVFNGTISKPGAYSPEFVVPYEPFFKELRKRKMIVLENGKVIN
ncbi:MAG: saccharopine dehydrogenase C-terminal domain-containing protein [Nanoarchaeota archaeon]